MYNAEDYKRCVCNFFGDGELDCPQEESNAPTCLWSLDNTQSEEMPVITTTNLRILVTTTSDEVTSEVLDLGSAVE